VKNPVILLKDDAASILRRLTQSAFLSKNNFDKIKLCPYRSPAKQDDVADVEKYFFNKRLFLFFCIYDRRQSIQ
jgi:hypothetical protein